MEMTSQLEAIDRKKNVALKKVFARADGYRIIPVIGRSS